jgi:Flp pilus assembly protein TadB
MLLERRRRRLESVRQQALLDAVRYGAAVMSRAGNALQMVRSLSETGPMASRTIFAAVLARAEEADEPLPLALEDQRRRVADPLFDDFALAVTINARHGGKLVPALEALVVDWDARLRLRQDAKALRSGQEASVRLIAAAPFAFLATVQLVSPVLLKPLHSVAGELLLAATVASTVFGYRVLQRISSPRRIARLRVAEGA